MFFFKCTFALVHSCCLRPSSGTPSFVSTGAVCYFWVKTTGLTPNWIIMFKRQSKPFYCQIIADECYQKTRYTINRVRYDIDSFLADDYAAQLKNWFMKIWSLRNEHVYSRQFVLGLFLPLCCFVAQQTLNVLNDPETKFKFDPHIPPSQLQPEAISKPPSSTDKIHYPSCPMWWFWMSSKCAFFHVCLKVMENDNFIFGSLLLMFCVFQ